MSHSLINLTLPVVIQEIENVLNEYPKDPYQLAFSTHKLRQKLIAHVLSHVPNHYITEEMQKPSNHSRACNSALLEEHLQRKMVIYGSILDILRENTDWLVCNIPLAHTGDPTVVDQLYQTQKLHY
jgi:hypothetical protein